ncbi:U-box domain-containing protein 4-like [Dioscorea cayenensis subsp. rotundata]|uniref:U-box domain-containing protein 4-like n=1 Tax=Dioscorea cayennensis subsp. rotundata TaxID=55577 RepID=A0AB40B6N2_DIOCR|nr:U-box domain-containing protein 4-like [Dioscorea cayenensis subsp. rotundata]
MALLVMGCSGEGSATKTMAMEGIMEGIFSEDVDRRIGAAKEIRRLTKTSTKHRQQLSGSIEPLVSMLRCGDPEATEAAILALLNLAVKDERNKIKIVDAGALEPLVEFLQSADMTLQEYATAALLTLTASSANKPTISAVGAIPILAKILKDGNPQARIDAVRALYNLSTLLENVNTILASQPIPALVNLLKSCKKSSRSAEYCTALLESLLNFEEARNALTAEEGGVLAVVEVLEEGSPQSKAHALGALLTMCESDRSKYREVILKEGVIPGLLELTVHGSPKAQSKARTLLQLLRNSPYPRPELQADTLENIVCNIVSKIDNDDRAEKAKKMLAEMVQVSMEQSLRHMQQRAIVCTPAELPLANRPARVPSK